VSFLTTTPSFIWTTRDDQKVPFVHSTSFSDALARNDIDHQLHVFEHGAHGLGVPFLKRETGLYSCGSTIPGRR
jgi:predicted esterase